MSIEANSGPLMPPLRGWPVADLESLPDDGLQYELLDGMLLVSPAPVPLHQRVVLRLAQLLCSACPGNLEVFIAPLDWQPDPHTSLQPDLLVVAKRTLAGAKNITAPLVLAVEVLSPSTRRKDLLLKRSRYLEADVASYWVIDPDRPSFTAMDLIAGSYQITAEALGDQTAEPQVPFEVRITPSRLIND
jgi:Uma2 family endonuclease